MKPIVIFGASDAAQLAYYYFTRDSPLEVVAFATDAEYLPESGRFCGLPVVAFASVAEVYPPDRFDFFVALGYSKLNRLRRERFEAARALGYHLVSYVSSRATVLNEGRIGSNCFILEDNTIQPFVTIGNNVTMWSGNHIGHHSTIADHCFLASHIVVSGRVSIGQGCFVGVNATFRDNIKVGENCVFGAGTLILADVEPNGLYIGSATERSELPSHQLRAI